jgi:hypothetical protein
MKIAVLTEGDSEVKSLSSWYEQLHARTGHRLLNPLKINVDPLAAPGIIARECKSRLQIAQKQGAQLALVLLDREQRNECPGMIALTVENAIERVCPILPVKAVLKDRTFENWLISDPSALEAQPARFKLTQATKRRIQPNRADTCDAEALLHSIVLKQHYQKVPDSKLICAKMDVVKGAANSRSLRHLLHILGIDLYADQCKHPR